MERSSELEAVIERWQTGCRSLDRLLGGGFEAGAVSQIYGGPGSGKTNICIQLVVECVKRGKKAVYIDTEGLSPERFRQIAGENFRQIAANVMIFEPLNFHQQQSAIEELKNLSEDIGVVVLDSATMFYRLELDDETGKELRRQLGSQMITLLELARRRNFAAVVTNQVYTDIDSEKLCPIGGLIFEYTSKTILELERLSGGRRRAIIRKHRSRPEGLSCEFVLREDGVRDLEGIQFE
ncbi:MAG TPA: DNA repair and recombination protein RadB [Candidatus Syntrophoarchaeum butanivorans]|uniref:DNA repair and recombination protein RadB n=1 Tax=Candidatus Syntropharchaeum butanivorans TaxID=1839936 RepID=A0A1F2P606_9EURY|nr:MAG: DNA repair and recombination protein RadB [Candidatus Syntrophoarchaeum butanivorans]RJS71151.1 MAG: DNA repair and recombination protein RadB [Candidatus Syntrophoarchaeum sp. WYZ-LMO15]HDM36785.1 DNA repair and recombination protein RadB [Candidatus Syntrophoarchaeum butanivorans]HEC56642.1 DNA repair and recombination protein RadB [Candidatus Syntrophoarchaeum butanivorans]